MSSTERRSPALAAASSSKLPRFLQKQSTRDRSKSAADASPVRGSPTTTTTSNRAAHSPSPEPHAIPPTTPAKPRKTSKFLTIAKDRKTSTSPIPPSEQSQEFGVDEPPIIVEPHHAQSPSSPASPVPIPSPRPRTRSERPAASAPEPQHLTSVYASTSSTGGSRIGDLPTRLSGWFAQTFSTSSTDLSLPNIIAQHSASSSRNVSGSESASPRKLTGASALLAAAKHGKDKAIRYLLDTDAVPDNCTDPIWLLGVMHPGWEPPPPPSFAPTVDAGLAGIMTDPGVGAGMRYRQKEKSGRGRAGSWRSSGSSMASSEVYSHLTPPSSLSASLGAHPSQQQQQPPPSPWPQAFYADFTSRIWLTYRSHFSTPIRDARLGDLDVVGVREVAGYGRGMYDGGSIASSGIRVISTRGGGMERDAGSQRASQRGRDGSVSSHGGSVSSSNYSNSASNSASESSRSPATGRKPWNWGAEKTWASDTGWGCMLRTGQSLLANALVEVHLGRDWRRPSTLLASAEYATYVKILTWFLDTPAPQAPFSVHRMALAGKELGTDVGRWFGPSVAAGALRTLVNSFPECGLSVALATDGTLYQSQVFAASHGDTSTSRSPRRQHASSWGGKPVLLLVGIRLGIEGVNPIYYETIKMLYTFPQSVGIAGGRPSSSYYFVGAQADNLFYLDPHHARPAIPLRPPPPAVQREVYEREQMKLVEEHQTQLRAQQHANSPHGKGRHVHIKHGHGTRDRRASAIGGEVEEEEDVEGDGEGVAKEKEKEKHVVRTRRRASTTNAHGAGHGYGSIRGGSAYGSAYSPGPPSSPASVRTAASGSVSSHAPSSPSPLQQQYSQSSADSAGSESWASGSVSGFGDAGSSVVRVGSGRSGDSEIGHDGGVEPDGVGEGRLPPPLYDQREAHRVASTSSQDPSPSPPVKEDPLDPLQLHFCNAYSQAELKTFHCDRVRKMPLSGLDPSMLIGFLCRDEAEWWDFRKRVSELPKTIFSIENEPPTWPSDSDDNMGLESISEPDDFSMDDEEGDEEDAEQFFDTRSSSSPASEGDDDNSRSRRHHHAHRHSTDTSEEEPADPLTPGPTSKFDLGQRAGRAEGADAMGKGYGEDVAEWGEEEGDDIEDDWVDPSVPTLTDAPRTQQPLQPQPRVPPPSITATKSTARSSSTGKTKKAKTKKQTPVPVPAVRIPPVEQMHYPFPVTPADDAPVGSIAGDDRARNVSAGRKTQRMHTARARDGGRTQSGGVKGILADDL
ncbi:hypothetical protein BDN70DRAFT_861911 [Pholiota conissans]|uniref:Autophagy-related protein 4 n=1 Tax=Pholiota conissans TaxID=109636 RepID=A0A9P5YZ86_9AGAR|nr:hypothetical protein BDN70DRAFT_861911 [Pholiota conissans]